ncbi:MAG: ATP-binding protein [Spirulinaceae cyanobacterium]
MANTVCKSWYQTNLEIIQQEVERIQQLLAAFVKGEKTATIPPLAIPETSALGQLSFKLNLSSFEQTILLLCVGMEIDPYFATLCAKAQGNSQQNFPTFGLALSVFPDANWSVLSTRSSLQHWQLVEFAPGFSLTQTALRIDKRILCYILGETSQDEALEGIVTFPDQQIPLTPLPPSQQNLTSQLIATWSQAQGRLPLLQLCGADWTSKVQIAEQLCQRLNLNLGIISPTVLPNNPKAIHQLQRRWEREAILSNLVLLLHCDQISSSDPLVNKSISLFVENLHTPIIVSTSERLQTQQRPVATFDVTPPSFSERKQIWQSHLGTLGEELNGSVDKLVTQFNLSPQQIRSACLQINTPEQGKATLESHLWELCRTQARPRLQELAQHIDTKASWDDLVLADKQKEILQEIQSHLRQRSKVYEQWGFADKEKRGLGLCALFAGESGTGKTMAAGVLAKTLNLDLFRIDLSAVVSKYIGETEKNLRQIFDAAETGGAILLFDEADAIFGKRTEVKSSHDRHANVEVSYLLQRLEAYQGLAILTSNLPDSLDQAFLRRIRFIISFPFPNRDARTEIWRRVFPPQTPTEGLDFLKLSQLSITGGYIRTIALNAAMLAADADKPVKMEHIIHATKNEYAKMGRPLTADF